MNTWQALKKIVRDQFTKPVPELWDGEHKLKFVAFMEHAAWPDDYHIGWVWQCSCGIGTNKLMHTYWVHSEEKAVDSFKSHRALHIELDPWNRPAPAQNCPTRLMDGRNEIRCWLTAGHEGDCK